MKTGIELVAQNLIVINFCSSYANETNSATQFKHPFGGLQVLADDRLLKIFVSALEHAHEQFARQTFIVIDEKPDSGNGFDGENETEPVMQIASQVNQPVLDIF